MSRDSKMDCYYACGGPLAELRDKEKSEGSLARPHGSVAVRSGDLLERLEAYRAKLFAEIKRELEIDGHCKSYEGRVELHWPCYFGGEYSIHLACYVLGPSRGYDYYGSTWDECFDKAEADLDSWIKANRDADAP